MIYATQEELLAFFGNNLLRQKLYHTLLLIIPSRSDKTALVSEMAAISQCQRNSGNGPCRRCPACVKIKANIHPDVFFVEAGEKKSISIDQVREVSQQTHLKPWEGKYKIFILTDVHFLGEEAGNALLKTLEEPPLHNIFVLTAQNEHAVLPTIVSRCQVFSVGEKTSDTVRVLVDKHRISELDARVLFELGEGTLAGALAVKECGWAERGQLFKTIVQGEDPVRAGEKFAGTCGEGEEARRAAMIYLDYLASFVRDILVCQAISTAVPFLINRDFAGEIRAIARSPSSTMVFQLLDFLLHAKTMVAQNVTLSLIWENVFLQIEKTCRR